MGNWNGIGPEIETDDGRKRRVMVLIVCGATVLAAILLILFLTGTLRGGPGPLSGEMVVGTDIAEADVTEFYHTVSSSTDPPEFQRYRLYAENGKHYFYHETREGNHWPLRETDITVSGTRELTEEEWASFFACLSGGTVRARSESADAGGSGPWLYLYWKGDRGKYQEFSFASWGAQRSFEELCRTMRDAQ